MKKIAIVSTLLFIVLLMLGFILWIRYREFQENERILMNKVRYATMMEFIAHGEYMTLWNVYSELNANRRNPDSVDYTEIVFVHSLEEADRFEEHVLVVWPSRACREGTSIFAATEGRLAYFNFRIRDNYPDIDFRDYGLTADEITMVDVVDNWEIVNELIGKHGRLRL